MGMIASYRMVDMETIDRLLQLDDYDLTEELQEIINNTSLEVLDIDEYWDGLHFLLTGKTVATPQYNNPLSEAVIGAHPFNEDKNFFTFLRPGDIREIIDSLSSLQKRVLEKNFFPEQFSQNKIYPAIWQSHPPQELFSLLYDRSLKPLLQFYRKADKKGKAVIISIL